MSDPMDSARSIIVALGVRLAQHPALAHYSAETTGLIAERAFLCMIDMARDGTLTPNDLALRLGDDPALDGIPPLVLAQAINPILECIDGAIHARPV